MSEQQIGELAYRLWEQRGFPFGSPETDWFQAEQLLTPKPPEQLTPILRRLATALGSALGTAARAFLVHYLKHRAGVTRSGAVAH